ncbi:MAG: thiamine pyrophosphate-binding protein [Promethearchaeota archaeon]
MTSGEVISQILKKQGVRFIFTLCGGHISPILVGCKQQGIRVIDVRQEATAVFAADAISRLTGIPGVAVVTAGPGVTNTITAIKNAQMANSPVILLGGAVATILKGKGSLQDIEQIQLFKTLTKWAVAIEQDCDIVSILEEAFNVAKSGIPGPVFVECPIDLLYDEKLVRKWYGLESEGSKPKSITGKVINWYLHRHVDKLFACSEEEVKISEDKKIIPFSIDPKKVHETLSHLNSAQAPVLIIGSQAMLRVEQVDELASAVEKLRLPVYLTGMARGLMGDNYALQMRHKRRKALREADLVLLAGMPCDFRLDYGRAINRKATLISINRSREDLKKNRKPTLGIQADPSAFLITLSNEVNYDKNSWSEWVRKLDQWQEDREKEIQSFSEIKTEYINPLQLCEEINNVLAPNSIIVGDGGDFVATASYIVRPKKPLKWLDPGPFGTLGVGAGFALAAKLVHPDAEVWVLYGDGAAGYSIVEFDTFVRHSVPVIAVIGNDAGWTQITRDQLEYLKDDVGTVLTYNDYHVVAKGYGAKGLLAKNPEEIKNALENAKKLANNGQPVLINALIGKTDFRKGSISM